jgi:hypothetical protein
MLKTKSILRAILLYASVAAFISMAFDCLIWMDPKTPDHYLLHGTIFGIFMAPAIQYLERRQKRKLNKAN